MVGIKKLDWFILKNFALIFAASFFICLFIFMMQFTWSSVEDLIGKGLSLDVLAKFFWYMGQALIPTSLPLSVLLASLITFGNMGEKLELLAMKAAGVSLIRIMCPLIVVVTILCGISFYWQNVTAPKAQIQLRTLLFSIKQTSPALEIPEGIFYTGVPNVNLYVQEKDPETNMLYGLIIYKTDQGFDRAQIVLADSGKLEMTEDKLFLKLTMYNGEQFENLQTQNINSLRGNVPYDRETFDYKDLLIAFDSNFKEMDANTMNRMEAAKNMTQLKTSIDSMNTLCDSLGRAYYTELKHSFYGGAQEAVTMAVRKPSKKNQTNEQAQTAPVSNINFDTLWHTASASVQRKAIQEAQNKTSSIRNDLEWKEYATSDTDYRIRRHWIQWHQKMTFSLSCLIFFFVGAPLGAIIRKGGLGMPTVVSVAIFIFYYIFNTSGMKMARDGSWNMWYGMWVSSMVLIPLGAFLTYKANNDSVVFNIEEYQNLFRRILGIRQVRHIFRKEVIIEDPDYAQMSRELEILEERCRTYNREKSLMRPPHYINVFFRNEKDHEMGNISEATEKIVEVLSNTRDLHILGALNQIPVLLTHAHISPFETTWMNRLAGIVFPLGIILWFRMWRFRRRLHNDLELLVESSGKIRNRITEKNQT